MKLALPIVFTLAAAAPAAAQATWQPSQPPQVTAENTAWFQAGDPILWNNELYYPAGAPQGFNQYQMVRGGSYRGVPVYTDATLDPVSLVFVPIGLGRMQPYERRRTGELAGTTGSRAPSLPTDIAVEGNGPAPQAAAPPAFAPPYDFIQPNAFEFTVRPTAATGATESVPQPVSTSGRAPAPAGRPVTSAIAPTGANAIWVNFDGRRWYAAEASMAYDPAQLVEIGRYRGWTVYARRDDADRTTIYIPSSPGRLAAYAVK